MPCRFMKKTVLLFLLCLNVCWSYSQHITEQEALDRALQYMSTSMNTGMRAPSRGGGAKPESTPVEAGSIYAFNLNGGGFIIASADSRTLPVLGYSTTGSIDWDNLPDNMREWLKSYDEAIATLGNRTDFVDGNSTNAAGTRQDRTPVEPLIKTRWYQDAPYWDQVPLYNGANPDYKGKNCYSGCIATALAQVMYYYQWPKTVPNGIPDYYISTSYNDVHKDWHIDALPPVVFDWENMLETYSRYNPETQQIDQLGNKTQRNAVATLLRYCGQATNMQYSPDGSGSSSMLTYNAIVNFFGYASAQYLSTRNTYSIDEWENIMYDEVAAGRPVPYTGNTEAGSHAFVCDGYSEDGLFHINWGWGGSGDGYFSLSVLNPYNNSSAGSGSSGIGFCRSQTAVIHIDPTEKIEPVGHEFQEETFQFSGMSLLNANTVIYKFIYTKDDAGKVTQDYALGTIAENGALNPDFIGNPNDSILYDTNYMTVVIDSTRFQPGDSLKLHPMHRLRKPGAEWKVIPPVDWNLVAGRNDNGRFYINIHGEYFKLECVDGRISKGTGRLGERSDVTVSVKNLLDKEYKDDLYLIPLYYGHINKDQINNARPLSKGEAMLCGGFIKAGETNNVTFSYVPQYGGFVKFMLVAQDKTIGSFDIELNNDTLVDYSKYIENNSWFSQEGDKWFYNVEITDKPSVSMEHWIPSDSIALKVRFYIGNQYIDSLFIRDEIREYLTMLPDKGGKGDYTFKCRMPIELSSTNVYYMDSYVGEWIDGVLTTYYCTHNNRFSYTDPTSVKPVDALQDDEPYHDLLGRPIEGIPERKGIYIKGNRTVFIK